MITVDLNHIHSDYINWQALVHKALMGERVSIQQAGKEIGQIMPSQSSPVISATDAGLDTPKKRQFGKLKGQGTIPDDIHWGDDDIIAMFESSPNL